jgi:hypothetical protein
MTRRNWQRDELLLALNLYCRLPFGQYHSRNPEIIRLARLIDRTPDAVAMKLSNFASFDPHHQARGIVGLQNASKGDRDIWDEFNGDWNGLVLESELTLAQLSGEADLVTQDAFTAGFEMAEVYSGPTEIERQVRIRIGQKFFRKVIITSYSSRCCVCGMPIPDLLVASHIVAWRDSEHLRVNPHNGLCLCTLHDKAFDRGLFTLGEAYEIILSRVIHQYLPDSAVEHGFVVYEGKPIRLPDKFIPDREYIEFHRSSYFLA